MANLVDKSGDAYSNIVQGDGTATATFRMPGNVPLDVESVVATVDNAAGGATTATLVVRDSSGQVIATKRQGETVDAGASGTATWALRLDDERGASSAAAGPTAIYANFATSVPAGGGFSAGRISFAFSSGTDFLDLVTNGPDFPTFVDAGVYSIAVTSAVGNAVEPAGLRVSSVNLDVNAATASTSSNQSAVLNGVTFSDVIGVANTQAVAAGDTLDVFVDNNFTVAHDYGVYFVIQRLS